jgi:hypothetical protein
LTAKRLSDALALLGSYDFDIFEIDGIVGKKTLRYVSFEVLNKFSFFEEILDETKYKNFIDKIADGYNRNVVYHNDIHAADVLQTIFVMLEKGQLVSVNMTPLTYRNYH